MYKWSVERKKGVKGGYVDVIMPVCGRRRSLRVLCQRLGHIAQRVNSCSFRCLFIGSKSGSTALRGVQRLTTRSRHIRCLSFSHGFKGRTTLLTKLSCTGKSCIAAVSTSLRSPPSLLPRVTTVLRTKSYSGITAHQIGQRKRPGVHSFFTHVFCGIVQGLSRVRVTSKTESCHLVGHTVMSSVLSIDRCGQFSGKVFT